MGQRLPASGKPHHVATHGVRLSSGFGGLGALGGGEGKGEPQGRRLGGGCGAAAAFGAAVPTVGGEARPPRCRQAALVTRAP